MIAPDADRGPCPPPGSSGGDPPDAIYRRFVAAKSSTASVRGMDADLPLHTSLFDFQADLTRWALRRGCAAIFADTGLGKTRMELEWARCVAAATGRPVLILAPLAVGAQIVAEAACLGLGAGLMRDGYSGSIAITNYDRLHLVEPERYGGVALDESSIIKHHDARTFARLCEMFNSTPFRLAATATPAPNDYAELGTHAEFLGVRTRGEMLAEFFVHDGETSREWRIKGHARGAFWRWVAAWGALVRRPEDLGYDGARFALPPVQITDHVVRASPETWQRAGLLFAGSAGGIAERRALRRRSISDRVSAAAALVAAEPGEPWVIWCELNAEGDALRRSIPGAVEIRGSDALDEKERRLEAFARGEVRALVTKPSIAGWGLNWQHCARVIFVGVSDSWESYYQAIRRCWRFGQRREVRVHVISSEAEGDVLGNLRRKEVSARVMAEEMARETCASVRAEVRGAVREQERYGPEMPMEVPRWLSQPS